MFRKPKRNIRSHRSKINDSDEEGDVEITKDHKLGKNGSSFKENIEIEEDVSLKEIQSNISKFKEEKLDKKKKKSSKGANKEEQDGRHHHGRIPLRRTAGPTGILKEPYRRCRTMSGR